MSRITILLSMVVVGLLRCSIGSAFTEPIRIAMPSKSLAFLNDYVEDFQLDRKTAGASLREIVKHYSKDGTTSDDAIRTDIEFVREQNKLKTAIPTSQVLDYSLLKEALAELRR